MPGHVKALAAAYEEDPAEVVTFLESGRAGALLDALGRRETLSQKFGTEQIPKEAYQDTSGTCSG